MNNDNNKRRGRELFQKYHKLIHIFIKLLRLFPARVRKNWLIKSSNIRGKKGIAIRYCLAATCFKKIGTNVSIYPYCVLLNIDNLSVGDNVSIHEFSYIDAYGGIEIGSNVSISHGVSILSFEHVYQDIDRPIKDQGATKEPVTVCSDVWIGAKATILGGVTVHPGCIIGANAVVTHNTLPYTVMAGVPVKPIKNRKVQE